MDLDPLMISRLQFSFTIIFHIIFPTFTIGLSGYIATLCVMWMRTGKERYRVLAQFWTKIFAAAFAMGVVSGVVLSYQFGTNWSRYSAALGNVVGPMIGYEVLVAFFLEAMFLDVLLFGWNRVPPGLADGQRDVDRGEAIRRWRPYNVASAPSVTPNRRLRD
jgi:cytochrome d ubiquinol oxidase subunit I